MGLSFSLLLSPWNEILKRKIFGIRDTVETVIARSISFGSTDREVMLRTFSFNMDEELERSSKSDTRMLKTPVPLKGLFVNKSNNDSEFLNEKDHESANEPEPIFSPPNRFSSPKPVGELDAAAIKLQKVYKSYRTRRNLADCAVVVEELWWKALDAASLDRSSISFFNENQQETAVSRWYRARRRAAKVGKGLLQDEKAQKLALHHWLEAIDPRHRYGRNLHFYFDVWSDKKSFQPFFYWLDIGDGKEVDLSSCSRTILQRQCIQYLGRNERESYEVRVDEGKLVYKQSGILLNSDEESKWIFVLSTSRTLYVGKKKKGLFQHSSFLSGGATTSAGRLVVGNGILEAIWPSSGHYLPTEDSFKEFISFLEEHHVDMTNVEICSSYDDECKPKTKYDQFEAAAVTTEVDIHLPKAAETHKGSMPINTENIDAPKLDLTKTLSRNWSSGVGPRIGCVRDYPMELQCQALEKVSLSPTDNCSPRYSKSSPPIPSPRPIPKIRVSPRLSNLGLPSPRVPVSVSPPGELIC